MVKEHKWLSAVLSVLTALLVMTGSVAVPLLCRPFYYAHIDGLGLAEKTGLSVELIRQAYDEMMNFCLGLKSEFSVGVLGWSQSGMEHFVDVRGLFLLDLAILVVSLIGLAALFFLCRKKQLRPFCFQGHGPGFWGAVSLIAVFVTVAALAALNFDRAFTVFHHIFFPGKSNWIFDWRTDPIILLLPEVFFRNCALLIFALILVWCVALIASDLVAVKLRKRRMEQQEQVRQIPSNFPSCDGNCKGCSGCS